MNSPVSAREVEKQAAAWLARQDKEPLDSAEQAQFESWLEADSRHLGAYLRLRAVWARLDRLGALRAPAPTENVSRGRMLRNLAAAVLLALLGGGGWWLGTLPHSHSYDTAIGEMRRLAMEDGSVIEINTNSELKVAYSDQSRDIWLARGEGNFTVAHNKDRPFIVHAGNTTVTAVGTAFSVQKAGHDGIKVAVSEGLVAVRSAPGKPPLYVAALQTVRVPEGNDATVTEDTIIRPASKEEIANQLGWRKGLVILSGETLGEAAAEFNRYNVAQISVAKSVAEVRIGGVFQTKDIDGFANSAAKSFGLRVSRDKAGNVSIDKGL